MKFDVVSNFFSGQKNKPLREEFPLLPLRDLVLFPNTMLPIFITYKAGVRAIEEALKGERRLFAACVKSAETGETYSAGTVVRISQYLKLPDNSFRVVLQGEYRAVAVANISSRNKETVFSMLSPITAQSDAELGSATNALMRTVQKSFAQYAEFTRRVSAETLLAIEKSESAERLANLICNALIVKPEKKVELLAVEDAHKRLENLLETLEHENEIFGLQKNISVNVKNRMEKNHREFILREQLKEINKELGKDDAPAVDEYADLEHAIEAKSPPDEVLAKARKELARLRKLQQFSQESGVIRTYLEWIADLPWADATPDSDDLAASEQILNEDHFGMDKAKERIIEFIAVHSLITRSFSMEENSKPDPKLTRKAPILCFVGAPGTGKTSLGKSVARALGRKFVRMSLGGVRDEAEIRGHRKTYVGALPGKIIQSMRKAGTLNPVFLLDEIDKMSSDFRGDPASALLEVLDPEQNAAFMDHYLEVSYDLSKTLFIATANSLHTIPYPLLDRMEIIEIAGYGENEKLAIAKQFLIPKQIAENGLDEAHLAFKDEAIRAIIRYWTMESGVRSLEREIARCVRRIARAAVEKGYGKDLPLASFKKIIRGADVEKLLKRKKYKENTAFQEARVGVSYGLAWTERGGTLLPVETIAFDGKGELIITGNLGEVMKESARIALSYIRSVQSRYEFAYDLSKTDFHIHVPEGAIPKDGPSAGITLAVSLMSCLRRAAPVALTAMTGELTLTGRVLPIGGLKEKTLAAIRNGMKAILIPLDNKDDWDDLDKAIISAIAPMFINNAEDAFKVLFSN